MSQITARLSPTKRQQFEDYAESVGLNGSSLARLLLARAFGRPVGVPGMGRQTRGSNDGKLTAHLCNSIIVGRLEAYANSRRFSRAEAARAIFERELTERWLFKAVGRPRPARRRERR